MAKPMEDKGFPGHSRRLHDFSGPLQDIQQRRCHHGAAVMEGPMRMLSFVVGLLMLAGLAAGDGDTRAAASVAPAAVVPVSVPAGVEILLLVR
jgi:hypothetical protein